MTLMQNATPMIRRPSAARVLRAARITTQLLLCAAAAISFTPAALRAQGALLAEDSIYRFDLVVGRAYPVVGAGAIAKVTIASPEIADVVVISESEVVINAVKVGETDIILWGAGTPRRHLRVTVRSSSERRQIMLSVKFAEVRKDALRTINASLLLRPESGNTRIGSGTFGNNQSLDAQGKAVLSSASQFLTVLSSFNSRALLGLLEAQEQLGNARLLAEPNLMASNMETATFLAGGEIPVPVTQGASGGAQGAVSITYREYGVRLTFKPEVLSDSLVKLHVVPEVSSLDYSNSLLLSGFRVPALRTRRVESTVDVLQDRSLIISGLFNEEREQVRTGVPFLSNIPILRDLFASKQWQNNQSELIVVVTPFIMDPNKPRPIDLLHFERDSVVPARQVLDKRPPVVRPPQ